MQDQATIQGATEDLTALVSPPSDIAMPSFVRHWWEPLVKAMIRVFARLHANDAIARDGWMTGDVKLSLRDDAADMPGFLRLDGSKAGKAEYGPLFKAIGQAPGDNDADESFTLPATAGKLLRCRGNIQADPALRPPEYLGDVGLHDLLSASEVLTNRVWIDGKPVYRKVIDCGALPNATTKDVATGITGIGWPVTMFGMAYSPSASQWMPLPSAYPGQETHIYLVSGGDYIRIRNATDWSAFTASYVVLEYTKAADEAKPPGQTHARMGLWVKT